MINLQRKQFKSDPDTDCAWSFNTSIGIKVCISLDDLDGYWIKMLDHSGQPVNRNVHIHNGKPKEEGLADHDWDLALVIAGKLLSIHVQY